MNIEVYNANLTRISFIFYREQLRNVARNAEFVEEAMKAELTVDSHSAKEKKRKEEEG